MGKATRQSTSSVMVALVLMFVAGYQSAGQSEKHARSPATNGAKDNFAPVSAQDNPPIVCAFFGLDNDLPLRANVLVRGAYQKDGMPLNFRDEIDETTLEASDFIVIDSQGTKRRPQGATLRPANEDGENRTVLLIGEFGDDGKNPPVEVRIVGDLLTKKKRSEASAQSEVTNLKGTSTKNVIPLGNGPKMFFAQILEGSLVERPSDTSQVVQVAWEGGITPVDKNVSEEELYQFYTVYVDMNGELIPVAPKSIADVNDNDNFHQLSVDSSFPIVKVSMAANIVKDPNGDPNPTTEIEVSYGDITR
jgi:hypothetical protein